MLKDNNKQNNKLPDFLHERVLQANITRLEASLLKKVRELPYGEVKMLIVKFDGEPIRIEVEYVKKAEVLQSRDGLDLDDCVYIDKEIELEDKRYASMKSRNLN